MPKKLTTKHYTFLLLCTVYIATCGADEKKEETKPDFTLLKGVEPVCEAYLNRLNKSKFTYEWPPYCGRPEVVDMPPFETLNRVYLNLEEIYQIYGRVESFRLNSDQFHAERKKRTLLKADKIRSINSMKQSLRLNRLIVWRYDPMVDVDNDGIPDNVVIWFWQRQNRCGNPSDESESYPGMYAYIFNKETTKIDEGKTFKVFGHPDQKALFPSLHRFRTLNYENSFGIFKYFGTTYFDTFPYGFARRSKIRSNVDLKVYLRQDNQAINICQYHWNKRDL